MWLTQLVTGCWPVALFSIIFYLEYIYSKIKEGDFKKANRDSLAQIPFACVAYAKQAGTRSKIYLISFLQLVL